MDTRNFNHQVTACAMSISIGDEIPDFKLLNANKALGGDYVSSSDYIGENGLIIVFECNHCPYVIASIERINQLSKFANSNSIGFIGINSNDAKAKIKKPTGKAKNIHHIGILISISITCPKL